MKGIMLIKKANLIANTWIIPFIGQGFLRNISVAAYLQNPVGERVFLHLGSQGGNRLSLPAAGVADVIETSNKDNWFLVLNAPDPSVIGADPNPHSVVFAHRSEELRVEFGRQLLLHLVGEGTPDIHFMVIRYEFIPYWDSKCAMGIFYKVSPTITAEDFARKIVIPFSIREGLITYKITSIGGDATLDSGYVIPSYQKAGSTDETQALVSTGRGVIDASFDMGGEQLGMGSTIQDMIPVNSPGVGSTNQKTFSKSAVQGREGATLSFDFVNIAGAITTLFIWIRWDFLVAFNKVAWKGSFMDGELVKNIDGNRLITI